MNQLEAMKIGGAMLGRVRAALYDFTQVGVSPLEIEHEARRLIKAEGGELSFTKVPGYRWATCINLNEGIVHGIPTSEIPLQDGDLVTVDVGVYYKGYHTDAAFSKVVGQSSKTKDRFLQAGLEGLKNALEAVKPGARVGDISYAMESTLKKYGYRPTKELTGHGVGKELHEDPMIPNLVMGPREKTPQIKVGQTLAIEIIYVEGKPALVLEEDGWTIATKDGTLSAVHEETVVVTDDGYSILTVPSLFQIG
jgi:methionyl aminopeptidase